MTVLNRSDRALFIRCADHTRRTRFWRVFWRVITHLGGARVTVTACVIPLLVGSEAVRHAAEHALLSLAISHLIVQALKRSIKRPRPSVCEAWIALTYEPDRFSFPSGHSTAAMAVAFAYAVAFPAWGPAIIVFAMVVGASRVFLGVHYPGDVLIGQVVAVATALLI